MIVFRFRFFSQSVSFLRSPTKCRSEIPFLIGGILGSASRAEFLVSPSIHLGFTPRLLYSRTHHFFVCFKLVFWKVRQMIKCYIKLNRTKYWWRSSQHKNAGMLIKQQRNIFRSGGDSVGDWQKKGNASASKAPSLSERKEKRTFGNKIWISLSQISRTLLSRPEQLHRAPNVWFSFSRLNTRWL